MTLPRIDDEPGVACATCSTPLRPGTRAKINADGVIVCVACAEALSS